MMKVNKIARSVTRENLKIVEELITNATVKENNLKLKMLVTRNTNNLFGTDWMEQFQIWDMILSAKNYKN